MGEYSERYRLQLKNGNFFDFKDYNLEADTLDIQDERGYKITSNIIEQANRDGSVEIGTRRVESGQLTLKGMFRHPEEAAKLSDRTIEHRSMMNKILAAYLNADYLHDRFLGQKIKVSPSSDSAALKYLKGAAMRFGEFSLAFTTTDALWESLESINVSLDLESNQINSLAFNVEGAAKVYPLMVLNYTKPLKLNIIDFTYKKQQVIPSSVLDSEGNLTIDNKRGVAKVNGRTIFNPFERGSSFLGFEQGENVISFVASEDCQVSFDYYPRFFV